MTRLYSYFSDFSCIKSWRRGATNWFILRLLKIIQWSTVYCVCPAGYCHEVTVPNSRSSERVWSAAEWTGNCVGGTLPGGARWVHFVCGVTPCQRIPQHELHDPSYSHQLTSRHCLPCALTRGANHDQIATGKKLNERLNELVQTLLSALVPFWHSCCCQRYVMSINKLIYQ